MSPASSAPRRSPRQERSQFTVDAIFEAVARIVATQGVARHLKEQGIAAERVFKVSEGRPNAIDLMVNGEIQLLINTPLGKTSQRDDYTMRQAAVANRVPYTTTLSGARAACDAILSLRERPATVRSLQEWQGQVR